VFAKLRTCKITFRTPKPAPFVLDALLERSLKEVPRALRQSFTESRSTRCRPKLWSDPKLRLGSTAILHRVPFR